MIYFFGKSIASSHVWRGGGYWKPSQFDLWSLLQDCISCCDWSYCNKAVPVNNTSAVDLSTIFNDAVEPLFNEGELLSVLLFGHILANILCKGTWHKWKVHGGDTVNICCMLVWQTSDCKQTSNVDRHHNADRHQNVNTSQCWWTSIKMSSNKMSTHKLPGMDAGMLSKISNSISFRHDGWCRKQFSYQKRHLLSLMSISHIPVPDLFILSFVVIHIHKLWYLYNIYDCIQNALCWQFRK